MALLGGAACSSSDPDDDPDPTPPSGGNETVLIGQISDATTGKGIAGVPVTDGYAFTTTDADGNYRLVANRYCRNVYYVTPANYKVALDPSSKLPCSIRPLRFSATRRIAMISNWSRSPLSRRILRLSPSATRSARPIRM